MAFLFPPEVRLQIGDLQIYSYRLVILPSLIFVGAQIFAGRMRFSLIDYLVILSATWSAFALTVVYGFSESLTPVATVFVDTVGSYLIARTAIQSLTDARRVLIMIAPAVFLAGAIMVIESVSHTLIARPFFARVFGPVFDYTEGPTPTTLYFRTEVRMGLLRSYGTFGHPILGGLMLLSLLPAFVMSGIRSAPRILGVLGAVCGFFSLSSAAIMSLALAAGLIAGDAIKRRFVAIGWPVISGTVVAILISLHFVSSGGIINVISRLTINPATAYTRQQTWHYGLQSVENHPWFGIGRELFERPEHLTPSVDAHFLAMGISGGAIPPLLLIAAVVMIMIGLGKRAVQAQSLLERNMFVGANFSILLLFFGAFTVTFFSDGKIWLMCLLGIGASLAGMKSAQINGAPVSGRATVGAAPRNIAATT
ncbi:hypothetical protein CP97_01405 [Aurantiacibacter atlanticus]|uniref:O-antigen ligase-related domain-containing protein n=1 Tax=Aurantiacibacter atlanticus TaxID=1648404 RepID=A0A0H4VVD3_9SPHN|nr:hypothetical protein CP97_01405 [Aurantiacibacter atlanticus]